MLEAIFADLATGFAAQFGAPFASASATWPGTPTQDDGGSIISPGTPTTAPCQVQIDAATQAMRQSEGFRETDVRLIVIGIAHLDTQATITVGAKDYQLLSCQSDPAGIGYECRGRLI